MSPLLPQRTAVLSNADSAAAAALDAAARACGAELTDLGCIRAAAALLAECGLDVLAGAVAAVGDHAGPDGNVPAMAKPGAQRVALEAADNLIRVGGAA